MRLGELLVRDGLVSLQELEDAVAMQVMLGARLGTNLVEQRAITIDRLADALARQHDLPAALQRHFERADPVLQQRCPPALAARRFVVPLGRVSEQSAAVAFMDPPSAEVLEEVGGALGYAVVAAIAPELRVLYHLERLYGVARPNRFLRVTPAHGIPAHGGGPAPSDRRHYVTTLADSNAVGRISLTRVSVSQPIHRPLESVDEVGSLVEGVRAIRGATSRERVAEVAVAVLRAGWAGTLGAALLLTVREGMTFGWLGFGRGAAGDEMSQIAVPLDCPSLLLAPHGSRLRFVGAPDPSGVAIDGRLWQLLDATPPSEVVVVPMVVGGRVGALLYAHMSDLGPVPVVTADAIEQIARAAATGLDRLRQAAQR